MSRRADKEAKATGAIKKLLDNCSSQTSNVRAKWRENYLMFTDGTVSPDKEDWQVQISINKLQTNIRTLQGRLVNTIINNPDWFNLEPRNDSDQQSALLAPTLKKIIEYYLRAAKFNRHASTFFLTALISSGTLDIGWTKRLVQNPAYVQQKTKKLQKQESQRVASKVANPDVQPELSGDEFESQLLEAIDQFASEAQGEPATPPSIPQYVQIGSLQLMDVNHENIFWDPNVMYMEDSVFRAYTYSVNKYELNYMAKQGLLSRSAVKRIGGQSDTYVQSALQRAIYNRNNPSARTRDDLVKITIYYGPLIIDDEVVQDRYFAMIANESIILRDGEYPYWEPPGHQTAVITTSVRQIPYRATGAGITDSATEIQKVYDSNWQLACDSFRNDISGIGIVNTSLLADKSQLDEGVYPGILIQTRGTPEETFQHINRSSDLQSQVTPIQGMLEKAMEELTGVNELMTGGSNPYSRTSARETDARLDSGQQNVNIIALDLEQNFIIPALEKCFARILQFGIADVNTNPELKAILTEDEIYELSQLSSDDRLNILNQWYNFKISGFSGTQDRDAQAQRDNELLQIASQPGPLSQLINLPEFMKEYFKNRNIKNADKLLISDNTPVEIIASENKLLLSGHAVLPSPDDDDELHLKSQGPLSQSPYTTQQLQQHVQFHTQQLQQKQAQQAQQGGPPQQPGQASAQPQQQALPPGQSPQG